MTHTRQLFQFCSLLLVAYSFAQQVFAQPAATQPGYAVAPFEADITIPIGHACMGGGIKDAVEIVDPLWAKGFVLLGGEKPLVVIALDWCQCNNDSYDRWRDVLADAAHTTRERVLLATVHQHDAPICDLTAQKLLDAQGLPKTNCDPEFHERAVQRTADALRKAMVAPKRVTHVGFGQAKVDRVASNRRVAKPGEAVHWKRASMSGDVHQAPEGLIDPWLKTISLWDGDRAVLAWSCYSVHPMSRYGQGKVSADFPGMARSRRQADDPGVFQIYFTGCAGDTVAGKYNDGAPENRPVLADRLYQAMAGAWKATKRVPIGPVRFRCAKLRLPPRTDGAFTLEAMKQVLSNPNAKRWDRIMAALGLSWRGRADAGATIDVPAIDIGGGAVGFCILPAESFVGYQLAAQKLRADSFVMVAGFGDGAPGYIATDCCYSEGYSDPYCWVAPRTDRAILDALAEALGAPPPPSGSVMPRSP